MTRAQAISLLYKALENWKDAGGGLSDVIQALEDYVETVVESEIGYHKSMDHG